MNLYFLFTAFLYIGGCNARVVPLSFKPDESKHTDSRISENELIHESPMDEVEILGHSIPDIEQSSDLELLMSEDKNTSGSEISNRNASNLAVDSASKEKDVHEESNLGSAEPLPISHLPDEEFNLTSQFKGNDSDSKEPLENLQVNGTVNDEAIHNLTVKNETFSTNNSSSEDLEQESNIELVENEEILNDTLDHQNETFAIFEIFNGTNNTDNFFQLQPLSNDTEVEVFLSDAENITGHHNETSTIYEVFNGTMSADNSLQLQPMSNSTEVEEVILSDAENITGQFKSNNLVTENLNITNDSIKTAGGIFSGFEFLINSEVARNAAKAMEVFNFSDPLTDHIMEENEFHSFLPAFNAEQILDSANQTDLKTEIFITNSSGESNEIRADLNTSLPTGEETSMLLNQAEPEETSIMLNQTETLEIKNNSMPLNLNESLGARNESELFNLTEELERNVSLEVSSPLENSEETIQLTSEVTTSKENINGSVSNSSVGVPKCPPPGWCIFWFLSQDTCAVNEHCLGSRICCKIRCSKTCIEVELS